MVNITIVIAVFILLIWILNLSHDGFRYVFSTKETRYETQLINKSKFPHIILPNDKYLIFASVKFRDKLEKIQQSVKDPKELDEITSASMTKETIYHQKYSKLLLKKKSPSICQVCKN